MRLSFSKLRIFTDCPRQYHYAYREKLERPPISGLAFQRRLHRALRRFHQYAQRTAWSRWGSSWRSGRKLGRGRGAELRGNLDFQEGCTILRQYAERENRLERVPALLEEEITVSFGPFTLTGKVDRLDFTEDGGYSVIDYKLDKHLPATNSAEGNRQLTFYALLVEQGPGLPVRDVRLLSASWRGTHARSRCAICALQWPGSRTQQRLFGGSASGSRSREGTATPAPTSGMPLKDRQGTCGEEGRPADGYLRPGDLTWRMYPPFNPKSRPGRARPFRTAMQARSATIWRKRCLSCSGMTVS